MKVRVISGPQVVAWNHGVVVAVVVLVIKKSERLLIQGGLTVQAMALNDQVPSVGTTVEAFVVDEAFAIDSPLKGFPLVMK